MFVQCTCAVIDNDKHLSPKSIGNMEVLCNGMREVANNKLQWFLFSGSPLKDVKIQQVRSVCDVIIMDEKSE